MSWRYATRRALPIVAVDIPSGVMGDSGENLGAAPAVARSLSRAKSPDSVAAGARIVRRVVVADIGIPSSCSTRCPSTRGRTRRHLWRRKVAANEHCGRNKYTRGHALLYGGYPMTGAARMAARAAARIGAGLTTIAVPQDAFPIYAAALTSIMVQPLAQARRLRAPAGRFAIHGVLDRTRRRRQRRHARACAGHAWHRRPVLLDADAISVFASEPTELAASHSRTLRHDAA